MKMPIEWHRECLKNQTVYVEQQREELNRKQEAFGKLELDTDIYRAQIERAEREGRDGFDAARFGGTRSKRTSQ